MPRSCRGLCLPTLVLIAQVVFYSADKKQTDKQTDATERPTPRRRLYSERGEGRLRRGAATSRTGRNLRVLFNSDPFAPFCETRRYPENRNYITYWIAQKMWFLRWSVVSLRL